MGVGGNYFSADYTKLSAASASISFQGFTVRGITKFTFKETVKADAAYGNGSISEGAPAGQHSAEGSVSMFSPSAAALRQAMGGGWMTTMGTAMCSLFEPNGAGLLTYTATRVRLGELEFDMGEAGGNKPGIETFALTIHDPIDWDGIPAIFRPGAGGLLIPIQLPTLSILG